MSKSRFEMIETFRKKVSKAVENQSLNELKFVLEEMEKISMEKEGNHDLKNHLIRMIPKFSCVTVTQKVSIVSYPSYEKRVEDVTQHFPVVVYLCQKKNFLMLKELVKNFPKFLDELNTPYYRDQRDYEGLTPLYYASNEGSLEIVKFLVKNKADVNKGRYKPINAACENGHYDVFMFLYAYLKKQKNVIKIKGDVIFNCACVGGNIKIIKEIMKRKDVKYLHFGDRKSKFLYSACKTGSLKVVKFLLKNGVKFSTGESPINAIPNNANMELLEFLLSRSEIDVNQIPDERGMLDSTPLAYACENNKINIVKRLLKVKGIDVNKGLYFPLMYAAEKGNLEILKLLLQRNEINVNKTCDGDSALYKACHAGNIECVKELLKMPKLVVHPSCLRIACSYDRLDIVKLLLTRKEAKIDDILEGVFADERKTHFTCCKILLKHFSNSDLLQKIFFSTCQIGHVDNVILLLLTKSIAVNLSNFRRSTKSKKVIEVVEEYLRIGKDSFYEKYLKKEKFKDFVTQIKGEFIKLALCIGNEKYEKFNHVKGASKSAKEMATSLKALGFEKVFYHENLDSDDIFDEFDLFYSEANEMHKERPILCFVYFCGIVFSYKSCSYFLPVDFNPRSFSNLSKLYKETLATKKIEQSFSLFPDGSCNIIMIDFNKNSICDIKKSLKSQIPKKPYTNTKLDSEKSETGTLGEDNLSALTRGAFEGDSVVTTNKNYLYCVSDDVNINEIDENLNYSSGLESCVTPFCLAWKRNFHRKGKMEDILKDIQYDTQKISKFRQSPLIKSTLSYPLFWNVGLNNEMLENVSYKKDEKQFKEVKDKMLKMKKISKLLKNFLEVIQKKNVDVENEKDLFMKKLESPLSDNQIKNACNISYADFFLSKNRVDNRKPFTGTELYQFNGVKVFSSYNCIHSFQNNQISLLQLKLENTSFLKDKNLIYFEIFIHKMRSQKDTKKGSIGIGIGSKHMSGKGEVGRKKYSIGYHSNGYVFHNQGVFYGEGSFDTLGYVEMLKSSQDRIKQYKQEESATRLSNDSNFGENNVIGVGWMKNTGEVFFVKNGRVFSRRFYKNFDVFGDSFLPTVTMRNNSAMEIELFFDKDLFVFDIESFMKEENGKLQKKCKRDVSAFISHSIPSQQDLGDVQTLLFRSIYCGCDDSFIELFKYYIQNKKLFFPFSKDDKLVYLNNYEFLKSSLSSGCVKIVEFLFKEKHVKHQLVNNKSGKSITPLYSPLTYVCAGGNFKMFKLVYEQKGVENVINYGSRDSKHGDSPLVHACEEGNLNIVLELLKNSNVNVNHFSRKTAFSANLANEINSKIVSALFQHPDLDLTPDFSMFQHTLLHGLCLGGDYKVFLQFKKLPDLFKITRAYTSHFNPLRAACIGGSVDIVKELLEKKEFKKFLNGESDDYPLTLACKNGHIEVVKYLLDQKDILIDGNPKETYRKIAIYVASELGYFEIVKCLIEKGANINACNKEDSLFTPLYVSSLEGHLLIVKLLFESALKEKYPPNKFSEFVLKGIFGACEGGEVEFLKYFLNLENVDYKKMKINTIFKYELKETRILFIASLCGNFECVKLLHDKFKDRLEYNFKKEETSILYAACCSGNEELVKFILSQKGVDINQGRYSASPLFAACRYGGNYKLVEELLKHTELDVNGPRFPPGTVNLSRSTGFFGACASGDLEIVNLLFKQHGLDVNEGGFGSPLFFVIDKGYLPLVKRLLKCSEVEIHPSKVKYQPGYPLKTAIQKNRFYSLKEMLSRLDVKIDNVLLSALKKGNVEILKLILQRKIIMSNSELSKVAKKHSEVTNLLKEYVESPITFRDKMRGIKRYRIGVEVKTFYKSAFVIGMKNYSHLSKLKVTENDANEVYKLFQNDLKFDKVDIVLSKGAVELKNQFQLFCEEIKKLSKKKEHIEKTFLTVIYYSGHGISFESISYLLPIDFKSEFMNDEKKVDQFGISTQFLESSLNKSVSSPNKCVNLIILDACRTSLKQEQLLSLRKSKTITPFRSINTLYVFSTDPNAVAYDAIMIKSEKKKENSPFTTSFIEVIQKHIKTQKKFEDLLIEIKNLTYKLTNSNQKPWWVSSVPFPIYLSIEKEIEYVHNSMNEEGIMMKKMDDIHVSKLELKEYVTKLEMKKKDVKEIVKKIGIALKESKRIEDIVLMRLIMLNVDNNVVFEKERKFVGFRRSKFFSDFFHKV